MGWTRLDPETDLHPVGLKQLFSQPVLNAIKAFLSTYDNLH